jgi:hypothetical protein
MKIKVIKKDYHRNGISGTGFSVVIFKTQGDPETKGKRMISIVFPNAGDCAVFDLDELAKENIEFANGNSWRGDYFEPELRKALQE